MSAGLSTRNVLGEVFSERQRQNEKWGEQNHDDVISTNSIEFLVGTYGIPSAANAKSLTDELSLSGELTWADILIEEVAEAVEAAGFGSTSNLREELVQVAAVAVAWVEAIDRRP